METVLYPNYRFGCVVHGIERFTNNLEFRDKVARQHVNREVDDAGKEFQKILDKENAKYAKN